MRASRVAAFVQRLARRIERKGAAALVHVRYNGHAAVAQQRFFDLVGAGHNQPACFGHEARL
jgi:hypothetical protein